MFDITLGEWAALAAICLSTAMLAVLWLSPPTRAPLSTRKTPPGASLNQDPVFLFEGRELIDASAAARAIAGDSSDDVTWNTLREALLPNFPSFPPDPDQVRDSGRLSVPSLDREPPGEAMCEWIDGITRVHLRSGTPLSTVDLPPLAKELDILRTATNAAPYPAWRVDDQGQVTWCNSAYATLVRKVRGRDADTAETLFPEVGPDTPARRKQRQAVLLGPGKQRLWYDVWTIPQKGGHLCYAMDMNAVVDAEAAQRNFVQTLTKTFAQLSIGLAIFDRNRQLALFNPALIDLTSLPADFLSARPSLLSFFDRLRDSAMMPEPDDYNSWRQELADLVEAAASGQYQETWSLASGSVYSVSGRPHPDGAVAFLFEDITAEITLTRRFRADLEQSQAVLDALGGAIAVFAPDGALTFCNAAHRSLWGIDPDSSFAQYTVVDATRNWQDQCLATPLWGELRDFVSSRENRTEWQAEVRLRSGARLDCTVRPIQKGATMVEFTPALVPPAAVDTETGSETAAPAPTQPL
ncbi:PAS-domain containing protein [Antarcticimicrobium sediminis]|uniref:PAS domain-containing protein n=1 Tax=Antarcticimicrobium sediminis TaxID=2546227 RepID=A0A4R5EQB5_9RHOB|nr:PAS-domain containing protein [Antarcticimicrobium sediminis]TDE36979.1 PAS domain-containing protein [Antarcticimicrobium sediminis]